MQSDEVGAGARDLPDIVRERREDNALPGGLVRSFPGTFCATLCILACDTRHGTESGCSSAAVSFRYMAPQHTVLDNAVGLGIAYGAGLGMVLGIAIVGAPGIAVGAACGAGLGVLAGLVIRTAFPDARR